MVTFWTDAGTQAFSLLGRSASAFFLMYGAWLALRYHLEPFLKNVRITWFSGRESHA